jgi:Zn-dependent peptidase ImmA (M78 family)
VLGQRQIALELASGDDRPVPVIDLHLRVSDDTEESGGLVRQWLSPPAFQTRDPYTILNTWVSLIEDKGVLVVQLSGISIEEMRGFSIGEHPLPVIALNGSEFPRGKLFTLMHELVHILLHRSALCDLEDTPAALDTEGQRLERFCNSVAAASLMPRDEVLGRYAPAASRAARHWSDTELSEMSGQFGVSLEAMLLRLVTLNLASWEFYRDRRKAFLEQYRQQRENSTGFLTYYNKQIRNLGRRYISTVWRAYERGDISDPDLSTYLQTQIRYVPRLIQEAGLDQ